MSAAPPGRSPASGHEPPGAHAFAVEVDGVQHALFLHVSGLSSRSDVYEVREGGRNDGTLRFRGPARWGNLVLRGGLASSSELWQWRREVLEGAPEFRRDGAVVLLDAAFAELRRWEFHQGWPVVWEGPELDSNRSQLAIERIEIAHHGLEER